MANIDILINAYAVEKAMQILDGAVRVVKLRQPFEASNPDAPDMHQ